MSNLDDQYKVISQRGSTQYDPKDSSLQAINPPILFNGSSVFSQIIVAPKGRTVWISGLIGCGPDNVMVSDVKHVQIRQAFQNLKAAIDAAGCSPAHCVRITEYIVNYSEADAPHIIEGIRNLFAEGQYPTNVFVPVDRLGRDTAFFELDAYCVIPD